MGITDKINNMADNVKTGVTSGLTKTLMVTFRAVTGFFLGLTLALVGQELSQYGHLSLLFVTLLILVVFMRVSRPWTLAQILIFDLVMILVAQLLRMYILLAP